MIPDSLRRELARSPMEQFEPTRARERLAYRDLDLLYFLQMSAGDPPASTLGAPPAPKRVDPADRKLRLWRVESLARF
jgi:hypothetical protein